MFEHYREFPVHSLNTWLSEMAEIAEKSTDSSSLPKLELLLRSGSAIRGHILKLQHNAHDQMLMIASLKNQYNDTKEVIFISASEVMAITLLDPEAYLKQYVLPAASKDIGKLELKRALQETNEKVNFYFQDGISIQFDATTCPNNARWEVLQVLETLPELMQHLTADELGKKLVNEKIKSIEITVSDHARTTLDQYVLSIQLTTPFASTLNAEKEKIKNEIERLL